MENKKKVGLIVTIVTLFLCGCPGICSIAYGAFFSQVPALENANFEVTGDPEAFTYIGIATICIGVIGILIPLAAGVFTLIQRRKDNQVEEIKDIPNPLSGE